jgi:hypothetical protein
VDVDGFAFGIERQHEGGFVVEILDDECTAVGFGIQ